MFRPNDYTGTLLLIEDDRSVAQSIGNFLESRGHSIDFAEDGLRGLHLAISNRYDVIILDWRIPELDGLRVCRKLRSDARNYTPILMLTGCATLEDKLDGLQAGADDYLVKPFAMRELEARLKALIRRERHQVSAETLKVGDLVFDTSTLRVLRGGRELILSPIGLRILNILMRESPRVVTRQDIEHEIWGESLPDSDTLRSHLYSLRQAIDKPFDSHLLHTVHSAGYKLVAKEGREGGQIQPAIAGR